MDPNEPIIPQDEQTPDPGYTHEDLQKESLKDIVSNTEEPKAPEVETPPVEEPVKPTISDEDRQAIADEAITKAKAEWEEEQRKKQEDAEFEEKKKQVETNISEEDRLFNEWAADYEKTNGKPASVSEAKQWLREKVEQETQLKQDEQKRIQDEETRQKSESEAEEQRRVQSEIDERDKQLNAIVDDELNDLYNAGKLTKIQDPSNPSDQGVVERRTLFQKWQEVNADRRSKNLPEITSATRIYEFYYQKPNAMPAGENAPIQGNRGSSVTPEGQQDYSYSDIKKSWNFFKRNG